MLGGNEAPAKVLGWLEHQIFFDDAGLLKDYLARSAAGDPVANQVLRRMEACSTSVLRLLTESLANGPIQPIDTQRVLLEVLAKLVQCKKIDYPARPEEGEWQNLSSAIEIWVDRLSPAVRREPALIGDAEILVEKLLADPYPTAAAATRGDIALSVLGCREILAPLCDLAVGGDNGYMVQLVVTSSIVLPGNY